MLKNSRSIQDDLIDLELQKSQESQSLVNKKSRSQDDFLFLL